MPEQRKLDGKVAIVTGAGRGIGRGISKALAGAGAKVVLASRSPEPLESAADEIRALGGEALPLMCDVGDERQVKQIVSGAIDAYGRLDIVVNNAQSWGPPGERVIVPPFTPLHELPEEWWDNTFQTGVKAVFYFCKAAFPYLKERGGKVINIGSAGGTVGTPFLGDFSANKEAIRGLSKSLAREWGTYDIQVNVICPLIATDPLRQSVDEEMQGAGKESVKDRTVHPVPAGRLGDADRDAGPLAVFLASSDSDYLTGQTFMLDGGLTIG